MTMAEPRPFSDVAAQVLASTLAHDPVNATFLGEHRHDGMLPDPSPTSADVRRAEMHDQLAAVDAADVTSADDRVDAAILRTALRAELFELDHVRSAEWDPMHHNPGNGLYALVSREFAPLEERVRHLTQRLRAVPAYLEAARERLAVMSLIHLDTAQTQLDGTLRLLDDTIPEAIARTRSAGDLSAVVGRARVAVVAHKEWLANERRLAEHDPRLGSERFAAQLALTLDTAFDPADLLARAEADLAAVTERIVDEAGRLANVARPDASTVRQVLDELAGDAPSDISVLRECRDALASTTDFLRTRDLITVFDDPIDVVAMPEIDRGVAVAYCRPAGPLEVTPPPTELAVSPTPAGWSVDQVRSFYREYNRHMLHDLVAHEAMPGHALQLAHSNRYRGTTPVRAVWWSGSFVEGWAVYGEELMADHGYRSQVSPAAAAALRMQQLKMQLRMIINAIMDVRYHLGDLDQAQAMALMVGRGFQEDGEAAGKWRRVQLTATQLSTYYVGYCEVRDLVRELRQAQPEWTERQRHDAVLSLGSPPVRHLRALLGL
jgi:uncharacterized protein (DUF885 family)